MDDVKVCRVCLNMDVKLYSLQTYPMNIYFEEVVGLNFKPQLISGLPLYACYECAALIKKYTVFRERCNQAQTVLSDIYRSQGQITEREVSQIDRERLKLTSTLTHYTVPDSTIIDFIYSETVNIKDSSSTPGIKEEFSDSALPKFIYQVDEIKIEIDEFSEYFDEPANLSSDDDEPLASHKNIEEKKNKKGFKKKKNRKKNEEINIEESDGSINDVKAIEDTPVSPEELLEVVLTKKRGRPRKNDKPVIEAKEPKARKVRNFGGFTSDEADIEEYVTVIKLTPAQQLEEIVNRKHSSNYMNAPFQCNLCYKGFIDTDAWNHHVAKHDLEAGDVECVVCKFRFKTKRALQKHAINHEKKYACKSCSYISKTTTQAKQHQRWHKGVTYKCQYCDDVSTKWTSYLSHVRIKHPSEFVCGICGYSFVSKLGLTMHKTMMHKDIIERSERESIMEGPYCEECDVQFISNEAWKRHMVTSAKHSQSNDFSNGCKVCGSTFNTTEELRLHHRKEHARKRPKNYGKKPQNISWPAKCEHCSEQIENAREYWTHFRRMHPDKDYPIQRNYVCDICGKSFRGNAFLVYHKRTHTEERAFKCSQCPKAFHNRTNLHMHERTHSDLRPYPCTVCYKAFKCKGALDRHFRSHTGVKPYECEVCGKSFGQSNSRKLHVRTVHLKQPAPYVSRARADRKIKQQLSY